MKKIRFILLTAALLLGVSLVANNRESMAEDASAIQPRTAIIMTPSPVYDGEAKRVVIDDVSYAYRNTEGDESKVQITAIFAPAETKKLVLPDTINEKKVISLNLLAKDKALPLNGVSSLSISAGIIGHANIICRNGDIRPSGLMASLEKYFPALEEVTVAEDSPHLAAENGVLYTKDFTYLLHYPKRKKDPEFKEPDTIYMSRGYSNTQYLKKVTFSSNPEYQDTPDCSSSNLETVVIPPNIKAVSWFSFHNCSKLTGVQWHDGVTELANGAFQGCTALRNIRLPKSLQTIAGGAFTKCVNLNFGKLVLPNKLQWIGDGAFRATKCSKVMIPDSLESYGEHSFNSNTKIVKPKYIK
ncbi:MAG: leucine-rich repeat domain-containing protein, partial [Lachnospiraceae bacterium]|nr:leucine-rich repeat domain-containing protein [Lachnospiraceae bacterium]